MKELTRFKDIYFVHERIKEIDPRYELMFNKKLKRFEVWWMGEKPSLAMIVHDKVIDSRVITNLQKTRISRIEIVIEELEKENEAIENNEIKDAVNQIMGNLKL